MSNAVPFALFDVLWIGVLGTWLWFSVRDAGAHGLDGWSRIVARLLSRTLVTAAAVYVAFVVAWGFNYRRIPLTERVEFDASAISPQSARQLAFATVNEINELYESAHRGARPEDERLDASLLEAFAKAQEALGAARHALVARPKRSLLDPYFRAAAVEGMTAPFFMETLVASDLLPVELPFVVAHEWSHLAGLADEGEANFLGWLTCVRGPEPVRYSGWLFLYVEVAGALPNGERAEVAEHLESGPRKDLLAIAERRRRNVRPMVSSAGWKMYDRYLKANRVEAGTASYGEVLRLVLGTRFVEGWTPVLKARPPALPTND